MSRYVTRIYYIMLYIPWTVLIVRSNDYSERSYKVTGKAGILTGSVEGEEEPFHDGLTRSGC